MKVLLIGSGGREHALAWAISKSPDLTKLYASPGSDAISELAELVSGETPEVDLVVIGPEVPLAAGLADTLRAKGLLVFGPGQSAARLESSKSFAKQFMEKHGIATARSITVSSREEGLKALSDFPNGVVIKADGLAAGKGVVVCSSREEAEAVLAEKPAEPLVLEERLEGPEVSLLGFCDGKRFLALPTSSDHKRLLDKDLGPNTGGMGVIAPAPAMDAAILKKVNQEIVQPTLDGLAKDGLEYRGLLYIGLMLTPDGPKVLEYNCRFGDPETQAVLPIVKSDVLELLTAAAKGDLSGKEIHAEGCAITVVLASEGYPEKPVTGRIIEGLNQEALIFHAGTRRDGEHWLTSGGRVLAVTGLGQTHSAAREIAYTAAKKIKFKGSQMRSDIGGAMISQPANA